MKVHASKKLSVIRIQKGLSVTKLAKLMDVNPSVISRMENGKAIRASTAKKVCEALNESFETLFYIEDKGEH